MVNLGQLDVFVDLQPSPVALDLALLKDLHRTCFSYTVVLSLTRIWLSRYTSILISAHDQSMWDLDRLNRFIFTCKIQLLWITLFNSYLTLHYSNCFSGAIIIVITTWRKVNFSLIWVVINTQFGGVKIDKEGNKAKTLHSRDNQRSSVSDLEKIWKFEQNCPLKTCTTSWI